MLAAVRPIAGARAMFFTYFAYVGLMGPYFGLWLEACGLSIVQIGLLLSVPPWLRIVAPPCWGWLADRTGRQVRLLRISAVSSLTLMLILPWISGMPALVAWLLILGFVSAAQGPIGETLALKQSNGEPGPYGRIRLWGSVGYIVTVTLGGWILDRAGVGMLPWMMAIGLASFLLVTLLMRDASVEARSHVVRASLGRRLREPAVGAFLASAFLMVFAHGALYGFWSIYLERQGYSRTAIGLIWALGVLAEIALFAWQRVLFERFDAMRVLQLSFVVCAVRFALIGWTDSASWVLVLGTQCLHAITFGAHHSASMAVLHRWFDAGQQARAQAAFIVVAYGLGGGLGAAAAGWLWAHVSPGGAFLAAAAAAMLGLAAISLAARMQAVASPHPM